MDDTFASKVFKQIKNKLLTFENMVAEEKEGSWEFLPKVEGKLHSNNELTLKWNTVLLQCIFQYHPDNIVKHWKDIEAIAVLLLKEWENPANLELGLDIIYNALLCLCKPHLSSKQFSKP
jgi:hypothetical protein